MVQGEMTRYFVNRRKGQDRRLDEDRCKDLPVDLYHRKRRKSTDRRASDRDLVDDYYAFMNRDSGQDNNKDKDDLPGSNPLTNSNKPSLS